MNQRAIPLLVILCIIIYLIIRNRKKSSQTKLISNTQSELIQQNITRQTYHPEYDEKKYFFTYPEFLFMNHLKNILEEKYPGEYDIFPKTRLADIFEARKDSIHHQGETNRIRSEHIDFLVVNQQKYYTPVMAIEVNGPSHHNEEAHIRDQFKKELFDSHKVPFLTIENDKVNDKIFILAQIKEKLG